jgi:hypothetical protein
MSCRLSREGLGSSKEGPLNNFRRFLPLGLLEQPSKPSVDPFLVSAHLPTYGIREYPATTARKA